jgi:hypothetical protein
MKKMHDEGRCLINTSDQEKEGKKLIFSEREKFHYRTRGRRVSGGGGGVIFRHNRISLRFMLSGIFFMVSQSV